MQHTRGCLKNPTTHADSIGRLGGVWLRGPLLAIILISGAVAIITVASSASASTVIASEAKRSLAIATMRSAVQIESEQGAAFVGLASGDTEGDQTTDGMGESDMDAISIHPDASSAAVADLADHPEMVAAVTSFQVAANQLLDDIDFEGQASLRLVLSDHTAYVAAVKGLNEASHNSLDAMATYHGDTQLIEADLRNGLQDLGDQVGAALADAVAGRQGSIHRDGQP